MRGGDAVRASLALAPGAKDEREVGAADDAVAIDVGLLVLAAARAPGVQDDREIDSIHGAGGVEVGGAVRNRQD